MPLPLIQRGDLWIVDLGYQGKVRPVLVVSVPFLDHERTLVIAVPHTTSRIGTRFEVAVAHPRLSKEGVFDTQQVAAIPAVKFDRKIGVFNKQQLRLIENSLCLVLGLPPLTQENPPNG